MRLSYYVNPDHVWSWDLIYDQTQGGSSLRILTFD